MIDADLTRKNIERATRAAAIAACSFTAEHDAALTGIAPNARTSLIAQTVVTYLASTGLVTFAPDERWDDWLPAQVEAPFDDDLRDAVAAAVEQQQRMNRAYFGQRG